MGRLAHTTFGYDAVSLCAETVPLRRDLPDLTNPTRPSGMRLCSRDGVSGLQHAQAVAPSPSSPSRRRSSTTSRSEGFRCSTCGGARREREVPEHTVHSVTELGEGVGAAKARSPRLVSSPRQGVRSDGGRKRLVSEASTAERCVTDPPSSQGTWRLRSGPDRRRRTPKAKGLRRAPKPFCPHGSA